jgi:hypothetical protein
MTNAGELCVGADLLEESALVNSAVATIYIQVRCPKAWLANADR